MQQFVKKNIARVRIESLSRASAALSSATQHAMPPEIGGKWATECLNTRFPLPTLLIQREAEKNVTNKTKKLTGTKIKLFYKMKCTVRKVNN